MSGDDFRQLRRFRAGLSGPDQQEVTMAKHALEQARSEERSDGTSSISGSRRLGAALTWRKRSALAAGGAAMLALALVVFSGGEGTLDQTEDQAMRTASLADVAAGIQRTTHLDYDRLSDVGLTLSDVASESEIVGTGRIVDVRLGYEEADGVDHMYLVVEPDKLAAGSEALGASGKVLVDQIAPQVNSDGVRLGFDELRDAAINAPEHVAFMLSPTPVSWYRNSPDPYAGRAEDDPVYIVTHPASLLAFDEEKGIAFPLAADEDLAEAAGNVNALKELGVDVYEFTEGSIAVNAAKP